MSSKNFMDKNTPIPFSGDVGWNNSKVPVAYNFFFVNWLQENFSTNVFLDLLGFGKFVAFLWFLAIFWWTLINIFIYVQEFLTSAFLLH